MDESPRETFPARGPRGCLRLQLVAVAVVGVLVLLVEGGLRLVDVRGLTMEELDPIGAQLEEARVGPHPYLAYANKPDYEFDGEKHRIRHNRLGFRGPETTWAKPEGVFRIVCLGGSSTYGHGPSANETTFPARLQANLSQALGGGRVEVINGGCQGYSSFESLANLALRMIDFEPDLVVVYHSINDVRCALYPNAQRDNTHWRTVFPSERKPELLRLAERSYLFQIWRRYMTDYVAERQNMGAWVVVDFGRYEDFYAQPEPTGIGFRSFQRNLVDIIGVAHAHGAEVMLVTQGIDASDLDGASSRDAQLAGMRRATEILKAVAAERSVPLVDGKLALETEAARQVVADGGQRVFTHEVHLTDEGADLLARTVADAILRAALIPE